MYVSLPTQSLLMHAEYPDGMVAWYVTDVGKVRLHGPMTLLMRSLNKFYELYLMRDYEISVLNKLVF